ncbi:hypothetical protein [Thermoproteus uzoniensis]|uniref:hypothetical protein n=1 Tax=Thermoproteus uzoniensis TaxID=184117 RepID=UPI00069A74E3|nr:hypothetical protein [Thermoproteus uzoniensis]
MPSRNEIGDSPAMGPAAGTIAFFAGFATVALFGITAKMLAPILKLSIVEVSRLTAMPALTSSLLRIPFGASTSPRKLTYTRPTTYTATAARGGPP